jgi:hypothetical protein
VSLGVLVPSIFCLRRILDVSRGFSFSSKPNSLGLLKKSRCSLFSLFFCWILTGPLRSCVPLVSCAEHFLSEEDSGREASRIFRLNPKP